MEQRGSFARLVNGDGDAAILARLFAIGARRRLKISQAALEMGVSRQVVEGLCRRQPMSAETRRKLLRWLAAQERRAAASGGGMLPAPSHSRRSDAVSERERRVFGTTVTIMRQASGLTEGTVASLVGISPARLAGIESGRGGTDTRVRARLAAVLGLDRMTFRRLSERGEILSGFRFGT